MITSEEIKRRLWNGANELRGSMDASRYKDYMLGLMFYKFLSDKTLEQFKIFVESKSVDTNELIEEYVKASNDYGDELYAMFQKVLGYYVKPEYLYQTWLNDINNGVFEVQKVTDSFNSFELSIATTNDVDDFKGLFNNSTLDLTDTALGSDLNERNKNIEALILLFADLDMVSLQKGDILGDAYEYLIGMFAMESGKKAGEFYTPHQVSEVIAQIVAKSSNIGSIYDPTVGSGSLLLNVGRHLSEDQQKSLDYYGQEKNTATYNLTRMNLLLHGVRPDKMTIKNADTLAQDWPEDPQRPNQGVQFDAVVMNPPYSLKNWNRSELKVSDPRFEAYGVLPPDSKGDFAFLLHGLFHLGTEGTMAIVLPHGVLFRGSSEGEIRKKLLEKNSIDAIIGLPAGLFTNTGIPVVIMVLKKNRNLSDPVLIIDASNNFIKSGKQNQLQEKDIARIVDTYVLRKEVDGYSHLASREEIISNDYNMNIPRYVSSNDKELLDDVEGHLHGGISLDNIKELLVLNKLVPDILSDSFTIIRPNYVKLNKSIDDIKESIYKSSAFTSIKTELQKEINSYANKYYNVIKLVDNNTNIKKLNDEMLSSMKDILSKYEYLDNYDGYQVIAELWQNYLTHDLEIISLEGFYEAAKSRIPNMVTKGSGNKKTEVQDGWLGNLIPNGLLEKTKFSNEETEINDRTNQISDIDNKLSDILEEVNNEDSDDYSSLSDFLKENGEEFDHKLLKKSLKETDKSSKEYQDIKEVENLMTKKKNLNKEIKSLSSSLKEEVQNSYSLLTNEEIDQILYKKWFGNIQGSILSIFTNPIEEELKILEELNSRYSDTLETIDKEILELESSLKSLMDELVVTK